MAEGEQQVEKMEETQTEGKPVRNVLISMDGSKHAIYAFECKYVV